MVPAKSGDASGFRPNNKRGRGPAGEGATKPFASGFDESLGILCEPISGDLYFLESNQLFRLESSLISPFLSPVP